MISIHALLAESDLILVMERLMERLFLSTLSLRRATAGRKLVETDTSISIHALLAESDSMLINLCCGCFDFYPRSPCGERPWLTSFPSSPTRISIHALLAESDNKARFMQTALEHFYPRSPCGERQRPKRYPAPACMYFYPRSPCGERLLQS